MVVVMIATVMAVIIIAIMAVMVVIVVVETSVIEKIIDDSSSGCGVDVRREKMVQFSPVQIIRRHASPLA
jgi:hypothetical protein